jgi:hypothetical protein
MTPEDIRWSHGATAALRALPMAQAERVDAAVQRFAFTGVGKVQAIPGDKRGFLLLVPPYAVYLEPDEKKGKLHVFAVFRQ